MKTLPFLFLFSAALGRAACADSDDPSWAKFSSGAGFGLFLAAGTLLPLVDESGGKEQSLRTVDALIVSQGLTLGLKKLTREERPDGSDNESFPSGHASAAFTVATMQAHYKPKQAPYWYGGAALISASRVALDKHYFHDVAAGAALGYFTAKLELKQKRGFILRPFIRNDNPTRRVSGLSFTRRF